MSTWESSPCMWDIRRSDLQHLTSSVLHVRMEHAQWSQMVWVWAIAFLIYFSIHNSTRCLVYMLMAVCSRSPTILFLNGTELFVIYVVQPLLWFLFVSPLASLSRETGVEERTGYIWHNIKHCALTSFRIMPGSCLSCYISRFCKRATSLLDINTYVQTIQDFISQFYYSRQIWCKD